MYKKIAIEVFEIEALAIQNLAKNLTEDFEKAVEKILLTKGRLIISGVGKSGIIGKKIAATLASTGTPSLFLHPVEAFHGDLGMIQMNDIFLGISYSGETEELLKLIPFLKANEIPLIAMTGKVPSTLSENADFVLNVNVVKEACPLELAPTSSTTATLAMGDALAVALMKGRNFMPEDFARFHPGGSLGRKLLTTVETVMFKENLPTISPTEKFANVIEIMTKGRLGLAVVVDNEEVIGIVTDGDLRRAMDKFQAQIFDLHANEIMTKSPKMVAKNLKMAEAEELMTQHKITSLLVTENQKLLGILQLYSVK